MGIVTKEELERIEASVERGNRIDPVRTQLDVRALIAEVRRLQRIIDGFRNADPGQLQQLPDPSLAYVQSVIRDLRRRGI